MSNPPVFAISPKHTTLDFQSGWTLENKIDVFTARIEGWQIGIAKEIINKEIPHRGFALLHIVFSYFEMIGKYINGYWPALVFVSSRNESRSRLKLGSILGSKGCRSFVS